MGLYTRNLDGHFSIIRRNWVSTVCLSTHDELYIALIELDVFARKGNKNICPTRQTYY